MKRCVFVVAVSLLLGGCGCAKRHDVHQLLVINVLDPELYADCHIKGSINVPFETVEQFAQQLDKNTPIVAYCSNYKCTASYLTARLLKQSGFKYVWAYEAGMAGWYQQGLPVEGPCKQAYLTMANKPLAGDSVSDVSVITTTDLHQKMSTASGKEI